VQDLHYQFYKGLNMKLLLLLALLTSCASYQPTDLEYNNDEALRIMQIEANPTR
jgi:hypothetical protein